MWSADGTQILFRQEDGMGRVRADGSTPIERLHDGNAYPHSITRDGATLLFQMPSSDSGSNVWMMAIGGDRTARPLLNSPANESWAELSPDGKWLAYGSDSSGRFEVYVQPFPGPGGKRQISSEGGVQARWRRDGAELFYIASDNRLMAVPVRLDSTGGTFLRK